MQYHIIPGNIMQWYVPCNMLEIFLDDTLIKGREVAVRSKRFLFCSISLNVTSNISCKFRSYIRLFLFSYFKSSKWAPRALNESHFRFLKLHLQIWGTFPDWLRWNERLWSSEKVVSDSTEVDLMVVNPFYSELWFRR